MLECGCCSLGRKKGVPSCVLMCAVLCAVPSCPVLLRLLRLLLFCCLAQAVLNIISNPVNSTVPIAAEALKRMGVYDKRKLLGVTTLDVVSSSNSSSSSRGLDWRGLWLL